MKTLLLMKTLQLCAQAPAQIARPDHEIGKMLPLPANKLFRRKADTAFRIYHIFVSCQHLSKLQIAAATATFDCEMIPQVPKRIMCDLLVHADWGHSTR